MLLRTHTPFYVSYDFSSPSGKTKIYLLYEQSFLVKIPRNRTMPAIRILNICIPPIMQRHPRPLLQPGMSMSPGDAPLRGAQVLDHLVDPLTYDRGASLWRFYHGRNLYTCASINFCIQYLHHEDVVGRYIWIKMHAKSFTRVAPHEHPFDDLYPIQDRETCCLEERNTSKDLYRVSRISSARK